MKVAEQPSATRVRLDVWLDVACVCRTRSAAQHACRGGKVAVNGVRARPHREITTGDRVAITTRSGHKRELIIETVAERHVPKSDARTFYRDVTPPPTPAEAELRELLRRAGPTPGAREGAPDRRARRLRRELKSRIY